MMDALIIGGGPGGLQAALTLGRARKRVVLCEAGPPRNAAAVEVHNFLTRDGTPPAEMRRLARAQLETYPTVEIRDVRVDGITGEADRFEATLADGSIVQARRVLLTVGMVDEVPDLLRPLWGTAVFQCPYCHGYEVRDRRFGYLSLHAATLEFALVLKAWTDDVVAFTSGAFEVTDAQRAKLRAGGVVLDERPVRGLIADGDRLTAIDVGDGQVPRDVLFAHPPQRQTALVQALGLDLDDLGSVRVDEMGQTSRRGIYAGGDLTTKRQAAIVAAAGAMLAAASLNHDLAMSVG